MSDAASTAERLAELEKERDEYRRLYLELTERCRKLELGLLASKSERLPDESHLSLDVLSMLEVRTMRLTVPDRWPPRASIDQAPAARPRL